MKKIKSDGKNNKYPTKRIPIRHLMKLEKIGNGNWRDGLSEVLNIYELIMRDPKILLEKEVSHFSSLVKAFASDNHFEHYVDSNLPAVLIRFIRTGRVDGSIMHTRLEKPIDEFEEKESKNAKKPEQ